MEREDAPPHLELPRRGPAPTMGGPQRSAALKPLHLKPVFPDRGAGQVARPSEPRPPARPAAQPARPVIPPYPVSGARGAAAPASGPRASTLAPRGAVVQSFGRLMLVGPQIRLSGEIKACERLVIEGVVEGEVSETSRLEVARGGRFQGQAQVESCAVDGVFDGDLEVRGVLSLKANGRIAGKVRYGEIEIERGGVIAGDFNAHGKTGTSHQTAAPRAAKSGSPRPA